MKFKKAFAFSFLALFLSIIIFIFGYIFIQTPNFDGTETFNNARLSKLNEENIYFQEIYLNDVLKFSLYNSLISITNESYNNLSFYNSLNQNISLLNDYIKELILNGTLNSSFVPNMDGKTIQNLTLGYLSSFSDIHRGNIDFDILALRIYEETPFYVNFQLLINMTLDTQDQIGFWNFTKYFDVAVPVFELVDPTYALLINPRLPYSDLPLIRPNVFYQGNTRWNLTLLNETLIETYSTIFFEPFHKYTLGTSYLSSLVNFTQGSYLETVGFWSFDYDIEENLIYDSSLNNQDGKIYGISKGLFSFNNNSVSSSLINDSSSYENNLNVNLVSQIDDCFYFECLAMNSASRINFINTTFLEQTNEFSISLWFNATSYNDSGTPSYIFNYGETSSEISVSFTPTGQILVRLGEHNGGTVGGTSFISNNRINLNTWNHLVVTYNGNTSIGKIYVNGEIRNGRSGTLTNSYINNFSLPSPASITIGSRGILNNFIGLMDEFGIYSKEITEEQIGKLFRTNKIIPMEYEQTIHGQGIFFNGKNNFIEIENSQSQFQFGSNDFSVCTWFRPFSFSSSNSIQTLFVKRNINPSFGNIQINLNSSSRKLFFNINTLEIKTNKTLEENRWYFTCLTRDSGNIDVYINDNLQNSSFSLADISSNSNLFFGKDNHLNNNFFSGVLDEVKIYNRSLPSSEIIMNYFSFNTFSKGCCNIISLVNTNKFGFNTSSFNQNISISSKLFIDNYFRGVTPENNILINLENITSNRTDEQYYNAFFDFCLLETYNLADYYSELAEDMFWDTSLNNTGLFCRDLIRKGIY